VRGWLATPVAFTRMQNEAVVRLLGSEFADDATVLRGLGALRAELAGVTAWLDRAEALEAGVPHRSRAAAAQPAAGPADRRCARGLAGEVEAELGGS